MVAFVLSPGHGERRRYGEGGPNVASSFRLVYGLILKSEHSGLAAEFDCVGTNRGTAVLFILGFGLPFITLNGVALFAVPIFVTFLHGGVGDSCILAYGSTLLFYHRHQFVVFLEIVEAALLLFHTGQRAACLGSAREDHVSVCAAGGFHRHSAFKVLSRVLVLGVPKRYGRSEH